MKKLLILVLLFIVSFNTYSQKFKLGLQTGYAQYKMDDFKTFVDERSNILAFETKIVQNFPSKIYFKPTLQFAFKQVGLGLSYSFHSTGARIARNDYSGEYFHNTITNGQTLGANFYIWVNPDNKLKFGFNGELGLHYMHIKLDESLVVYDEVLIDESDFKEWGNLYLEPGIKLAYSYKRFDFELSYAYFFPINRIDDFGPLEKVHDGGYYKIEWDGVRAGLTILYTIKNWGKE